MAYMNQSTRGKRFRRSLANGITTTVGFESSVFGIEISKQNPSVGPFDLSHLHFQVSPGFLGLEIGGGIATLVGITLLTWGARELGYWMETPKEYRR